MKRFTAIAALVFATERTSGDKYNLWDIHIPVEADGPKSALLDAPSRLKKFDAWKVLGYRVQQVLCGIRALHDAPPLLSVAEEDYLGSRFPILVGAIDEQKVQLLRSFQDIHLPYAFIHIEESS